MLTKTVFDTFGRDLHGSLILNDDKRYDEARRVWNGLIDKCPASIVQCADQTDVVHAVNFARNNNLLVAVRGGGHNVAGFGTCDDCMVIDLSPMKRIEVHASEHTARAQAGLTWGEFDKSTQAHGLATTGGLVSTTGIAGFTLGGGIGWLMRKHGLTIDNLLEAELITADGRRVIASAKENPDLFWGVRGGGGNFGIVTTFTYRLHPVGPNVYGGAIFHQAANALQLLRFYREWVRTLPDEATTMVAFITAPPEPFIPQYMQGAPVIAIGVCLVGSRKQGEEMVKPLRDVAAPVTNLLGPLPYTNLQGMFDAGAPKGILSYWKTEYLRDLDDRTLEILLEQVGKMGAPFAQVHIHHLEGAVRRVSADATAFGHRDAPFVLNIVGLWTDPKETDRHIAWAREFSKAMQPVSTGQRVHQFPRRRRRRRPHQGRLRRGKFHAARETEEYV